MDGKSFLEAVSGRASFPGPEIQGATVREAVRSLLTERDPFGVSPKRTLLNCGAVILASAALFWAMDTQAADLVLIQTEAIREAVAHYPDRPYDELAIPLLDGAAQVADGLQGALSETPPDGSSPDGARLPVERGDDTTLLERFRDGWGRAASAFRKVSGTVASAAVVAMPFVFGAVRLFFEMKGIADTLKGFYERRRGISPEQRIARLEEELVATRSERDSLSRQVGEASGEDAMKARLERMERQMAEDRRRIDSLMSKGVKTFLGDLDSRNVSIRLSGQEAEAIARSAALTGRSPAQVLENRLSEYARRETSATRVSATSILSREDERDIRDSSTRLCRMEDEISLNHDVKGKDYGVVSRHLRSKHAVSRSAVPTLPGTLPVPARDGESWFERLEARKGGEPLKDALSPEECLHPDFRL